MVLQLFSGGFTMFYHVFGHFGHFEVPFEGFCDEFLRVFDGGFKGRSIF